MQVNTGTTGGGWGKIFRRLRVGCENVPCVQRGCENVYHHKTFQPTNLLTLPVIVDNSLSKYLDVSIEYDKYDG